MILNIILFLGLLIEFIIFYVIFNTKCYQHGAIVGKGTSATTFWNPTSFMYLDVQYVNDNKTKVKRIKVDHYVLQHNEIGKTITILI